jgi:hypothetical protein
MTRHFLREIAIEGFRGVNNSGDPLVLKFKPECVNSVHAQNGVGKTSIFEALQYAIRGEIPRLKTLQDAEQGDSYIVNKFHPDKQATIELSFSPDDNGADVTIVVKRNAAGARSVNSPSGHPDPENFLRSLDEDFVLVDYHTFASFIDATALNRGRSFAALIGLSSYSNLRQALEGADNSRTISADLGITLLQQRLASEQAKAGDSKRRVIEAYHELTATTIATLNDRAVLEATATSVLAGIGSLMAVMAGKTVATFDHKAAVAAIEADEDSVNRRKLAKMREDRDAVHALSFSADHANQIDGLLLAASERDEAVSKVGSAQIRQLLKSAASILGTPAWPSDQSCPVCELQQPLPLKTRLVEKIALYDLAQELDAALCKLCSECPAIELLAKLETLASLAVPAADQIAPILNSAVKKGSILSSDLNALHKRLGELIGARGAKIVELEAEIKTLETSLPPSVVAAARAVESAKKFREEYDNYASAAKVVAADTMKLGKLQRWRNFIHKASEQFSKAETALSNARLTEIEESYKALFPLLMRGAPDLKPQLSRSAKSENIDLRLSDFHGETNVSARAVLSESYRNAVAASIFLSAATKNTRPPRFMVLDDITSSFDGGHQFFLMDALLHNLRHGTAPDGIQFIILSHDSALEKYFDKLGNTPDWHHQKLQGLPPKGSILSSAQGSDRLKKQAIDRLNVGDVVVGGPLVRQYLEYKLGYIISKLQIPVPPDYATRPDKRTLSTYLDAITSAVDLFKKAGICVLDTAQIQAVGNTAVSSLMSNMVSHYETGAGQPLNAYAMIGVVGEIDAYAENFRRVDPANPNQRAFYKALNKA